MAKYRLRAERAGKRGRSYLVPTDPPRTAVDWLRDRAHGSPCAGGGGRQSVPGTVLLYSRADAPKHKRVWANAREVAARIREFAPDLDVAVVDALGGLPLCDPTKVGERQGRTAAQAPAFARARVLLAPHGGHMGNLLWTDQRNTLVVEAWCQREVWTESFVAPGRYRYLSSALVVDGGGGARTAECSTGSRNALRSSMAALELLLPDIAAAARGQAQLPGGVDVARTFISVSGSGSEYLD